MSRGWVPIDEYDPKWEENEFDRIKPLADFLATSWSRLHDEAEQRQFLRDFEDDRDLEPEEQAYYEFQKEVKRKLERAHIQIIEEELDKLGVRMMRPYEHHNELESYYEYMERDRD